MFSKEVIEYVKGLHVKLKINRTEYIKNKITEEIESKCTYLVPYWITREVGSFCSCFGLFIA